MQLGKNIPHLIQSVDFLSEQGLKSFTVTSKLFVHALHLRNKFLHLPVIRIILLCEFNVYNSFIVLAITEMIESFSFISLSF